jgi:hypothetical protein
MSSEYPKWYQIYLTCWLAMVLVGVTWSAWQGDPRPAQHLLRDAVIAGAICGLLALLTRLRKRS